MTETVLLFAGQSAQDGDMFRRLARLAPERCAAVRDRIEGFMAGRPGGGNLQVQLEVFGATMLHLELLRDAGVSPVASAGLSLGEYAHLVDIGAIDEDDAWHLVAERGAIYEAGPSGSMAAIHPCPYDEVERLVDAARSDGLDVAVAVRCAPTQTVVAGERDAVDVLAARAESELFATATVISREIPMHTPRFAAAAERLRPALDACHWRTPTRDYWPNVLGEPIAPAEAPHRVAALLARHVTEPVQWRETVDALAARHPGARFVEVGPGTVTRDMMRRRWHRGLEVVAVDDSEDSTSLPELRREPSNMRRAPTPVDPPSLSADEIERIVRRGRRHPLFALPAPSAKSVADRTAIERLLPHRGSMLLLDEICAVELWPDAGASPPRLVARRRVDPRDPVFEGHFPGDPVYPGCLQLEAAGQAGICLKAFLETGSEFVAEGATPPPIRLLRVHDAVFPRPVLPGDELVVLAQVVEDLGATFSCIGQVLVNGAPAAVCHIEAMLLDDAPDTEPQDAREVHS